MCCLVSAGLSSFLWVISWLKVNTSLRLVSRVIRLLFLRVVKQFFMFPVDNYALEEGMAAHSSVLAWRIPWTEEPGGL